MEVGGWSGVKAVAVVEHSPTHPRVPRARAWQDVKTMMDTNVTAVIALCRAFTPGMVARNRGHLIFMSSIAAHEAYGACPGGVQAAGAAAARCRRIGGRSERLGAACCAPAPRKSLAPRTAGGGSVYCATKHALQAFLDAGVIAWRVWGWGGEQSRLPDWELWRCVCRGQTRPKPRLERPLCSAPRPGGHRHSSDSHLPGRRQDRV